MTLTGEELIRRFLLASWCKACCASATSAFSPSVALKDKLARIRACLEEAQTSKQTKAADLHKTT